MVKRIKDLYESEDNYEEIKIGCYSCVFGLRGHCFLIFYNIDNKILALYVSNCVFYWLD